MKNTDNTSIIKELVNNLDPKNQQLIITLAEALEKQQVLIANKLGMKPEELQHKLSDNSKKNNSNKIHVVYLFKSDDYIQ